MDQEYWPKQAETYKRPIFLAHKNWYFEPAGSGHECTIYRHAVATNCCSKLDQTSSACWDMADICRSGRHGRWNMITHLNGVLCAYLVATHLNGVFVLVLALQKTHGFQSLWGMSFTIFLFPRHNANTCNILHGAHSAVPHQDAQCLDHACPYSSYLGH